MEQDTPRVRATSLLMGLLSKGSNDGIEGALTLDFRPSQERLADMLGISRQWATAVVRELAQAGLVQSRYGRVTVLDVQALRTMAATGVDGMGQHSQHQASRRQVDRATKTAAVASGADAGTGT